MKPGAPAKPPDGSLASGDTQPIGGVAASGHSSTLPASDATLPAGLELVPDYDQLAAVEPAHYAERTALSHGGMGQIVTARDRRLRRKVAIKELRTDSPELRARFEREVLLTARLQHPSIVSILEAGRWPSGEPFYAMKLVPGRSLDKVITAAGSLDERLVLLPHVLAVADALGYAHSERIIHRDLKPQNVMVGEFGETVVIDWGLGKDLAEVGSGADAEGSPYRGAAPAVGETAAGEVLGTPAYMPPEQAEGAVVDERADVYAIGAILYHLLAGAPPYTGKTSLELLEAVKRGPPVPLTERQAGLPADLVAVVGRAMARATTARYDNARELAEDLRRFQSGQLVGAHQYSTRQLVRRWVRRHRTAVAVAGMAMVVLAVVGALSIRRIVREERRATIQRDLAERNHAEAEDLVGFMVFDLKDKLEPLGKLDALDAVAQRATDYYAAQPSVLNADQRLKRAVALRSLGDVLLARGDSTAALAQYRAAASIDDSLISEDPNDQVWLRSRSHSHERVGNALLSQGNDAAALAEFRTSLEIGERLAALEPADVMRHRNLATARERIAGVLLSKGRSREAIGMYRANLTHFEQLAQQNRDDWRALHDLVRGHFRVGEALAGAGMMRDALDEFKAARQLALELVGRDASNAEWQRLLFGCHMKVGDLMLAEQRTDAIAEFRRARVLAREFHGREPSSADWHHSLAASETRLADVLRAEGRIDEALVVYRDALKTFDELIAGDPTAVEWKHAAALTHLAMGEGLAAQNSRDSALKHYRDARAVLQSLRDAQPDSVPWLRDLAIAAEKVGSSLLVKGEVTAALTEFRASLALAETLAAKEPQNHAYRRIVAVAHSQVGAAHVRRGDSALARKEYEAALSIARKLTVDEPTNSQWKADVAEFEQALQQCCRARP